MHFAYIITSGHWDTTCDLYNYKIEIQYACIYVAVANLLNYELSVPWIKFLWNTEVQFKVKYVYCRTKNLNF